MNSENSEVFLSILTVFLCDGMSIEIRKPQYIFRKKIEEDTIILSVNQDEVNPYLLGILLVRTFGLVMDLQLLTLMETSWKILLLIHQKNEPRT